MHNQGEQIHVAVYPTVHEMHQIASRHYAFEGRCFVLSVGLILRAKDLPAELMKGTMIVADSFVLRGGSCVIAPDGAFILEPMFDRENIFTAELDLTVIDREKMTLDVSGHYGRSDVFELKVNRNQRGST